MGAPATGINNYLQFAREAVYATDLACTHRIPILRFGFTPDAGLVEDMTQDGAVNEPAPLLTVEGCAGFIETYLDMNNQLLLLDGAFGTATYGSNGGADAGLNPYTHTYNDAKKLFNSYTFELGEADVPTGKVAQVNGAKITRQTITIPSGQEMATIRWDFVAKRKTYNVTPTGALTAGTRTLASWRHITALDNGSGDAAGDQKIESIVYEIENPLLAGWTGASGQYIDEPVLNGRRRTSLTLVQRRHTKSLSDAYLAKTSLAPTFTLTSGSKTIVVACPAAYLNASPDPEYGDFGVMRETLSYRCTNGGSYASSMVVTNDEATITTP